MHDKSEPRRTQTQQLK